MGLCNNNPVNFGFIYGFVLKIGETLTAFWFKDMFLEFVLIFKGLQIVRVVSNVEEECFVLIWSSICCGGGGSGVSAFFLLCTIDFITLIQCSIYCNLT